MIKREWIHAWLLLLPALVLLFGFTHLPASRPSSTASGRRRAGGAPRPSSAGTITPADGRPGLHAGDGQQPDLCRDHHSRLDRARAGDGAVRAPPHHGRGFLRMAYFTPTVLPLIAVANIWLFFYPAGLRPVRADPRAVRPQARQLGRPALDSALFDHGGDDLEPGRLLHDLLPGRAADHPESLREAAALEGTSRWTFFGA
jgi:sn-glycerol 3-phosphate transport system permease protein